MEITTKVVKAGVWFQVQITQIEEVGSMVFSGPDKGIEKKEMRDTVILTFGKLFETSTDAETFSKTKLVLSTIKLIQKWGFLIKIWF
jgi:hypothetical protein